MDTEKQTIYTSQLQLKILFIKKLILIRLKFRNIMNRFKTFTYWLRYLGAAGNIYGKISLKDSYYLLDYAIDKNINFF